jgi:uncharacterized protein
MQMINYSLSVFILLSISVFVAGVVRGYSGFGFAMIAAVTLSAGLSPREAVPIILVLDIVIAIWLLPKAWRDVDLKSLSWLAVGAVVGIPAGVGFLSSIPAKPMRICISIITMAAAMMLWYGFSLKKMPRRPGTVSTGLVSGMLTGSTAIGGPPVILFYLSSPASATVSRASLIAFFAGGDLLAFSFSIFHGLVTANILKSAALFVIPLCAGLAVGSRFFNKSQMDARKKILILLMVLSSAALIRALVFG